MILLVECIGLRVVILVLVRGLITLPLFLFVGVILDRLFLLVLIDDTGVFGGGSFVLMQRGCLLSFLEQHFAGTQGRFSYWLVGCEDHFGFLELIDPFVPHQRVTRDGDALLLYIYIYLLLIRIRIRILGLKVGPLQLLLLIGRLELVLRLIPSYQGL